MPQLNPEFFVSQLFWLVVTFSFLLVFLWRISLPRIGSVLDKRERKINEDLATAKELQEEAQNIQHSIEEQLKLARSETNDLIKSTTLNLEEKAMNELSNVEQEMNKKIDESADVIKNNKQNSLNQINDQINDITKLILSKIGNFNVTDEDIKEVVKSSERQLH